MALVMLALGVGGIGIILVIAFYSDAMIMGIGIALGVLGFGGSFFGCIHLSAQSHQSSRVMSKSLAPPKIPPVENADDADEGELYYEPCSVSPARSQHRSTSRGPQSRSPMRLATIIPEGTFKVPIDTTPSRVVQPQFPLSPFDRRSFPVPPSLALRENVAAGSPQRAPAAGSPQRAPGASPQVRAESAFRVGGLRPLPTEQNVPRAEAYQTAGGLVGTPPAGAVPQKGMLDSFAGDDDALPDGYSPRR